MPYPTERKKIELPPGFSVIHSNRMEDLRRVAIQWVLKHPLAPLENEVFIVLITPRIVQPGEVIDQEDPFGSPSGS